MILLLDTSTGECRLTLVERTSGEQHSYKWQADRTLASGLLKFMTDKLAIHNVSLQDLAGLGVFAGPGSFTGLRIGMTLLNALAADRHIPIVTAKGEGWQTEALRRLENGEDEKIALPFYGREANITTPKK